MSEERKTPEIIQTPGQETLRRYRYQLEYALLRWLECLSDDSMVVVCELREDVEVLFAEILSERIQVKTKAAGAWSINDLTSKSTPVFHQFHQQYREDRKLTFRFVSNAPASPDLAQLRTLVATLREAGSNERLEAADQQLLSRLGRRLRVTDDLRDFVRRLELDLGYSALDDLRYRIADAVSRIISELYDVTLEPARLDAVYSEQLGLVLECSATQYLGDRSLTAARLRPVLEREARLVELSEKVDLKRLSAQVSGYLESGSAHLSSSPAPAAAPLDDEDAHRLEELTQKLQDLSRYTYLPVLAEDRVALADLLEQAGKIEEAQQQYEQGLNDCWSDASALAHLMFQLANFLARHNPASHLLQPYLTRYSEFVISGPSVRWVEATHVFAFAQAAYGEAEHLQALHKRLSDENPDELSPPALLHWHEAMGMLELIEGNPDQSIEHFDLLISSAERAPVYNPRRLRSVLRVVGPLLERQEGFDDLFNKFADFYEQKEAWGARADLFKDRAVPLFQAGRYPEAIPLLDVASEGYTRVAEQRGASLTRHMLVECLESSGKRLASLAEALSLALWTDFHGIRDISLAALSHAVRIMFDLGLFLDSLALGLTHAKMSSALRDEQSSRWSMQVLDVILTTIAAQRPEQELAEARNLLQPAITDPEFAEWLEVVHAIAYSDDDSWTAALDEQPPDLRADLSSLRESVRAMRDSSSPEPTDVEIQLDSMTVVASWREEPSLKWLLLGLLSWFERYDSALEPLFSDFTSRLEIRALPFGESDWAAGIYDYAEDILRAGYPSVLPNIDGDRRPRGLILLPSELYAQNKGNLGAFEIPCLHQAVMNIRGLFQGETDAGLTKRFEEDLLSKHSFTTRTNVPLSTSVVRLGAPTLSDA